MGSDGLKTKINNGMKYQKNGFTELFSRFGKKYSKVLPLDLTEKVNMLKTATVSICHSNGITDQSTIDSIFKTITTGDTLGDMRTVKRAILKIKRQQLSALSHKI
jgi:hypothetical protein